MAMLQRWSIPSVDVLFEIDCATIVSKDSLEKIYALMQLSGNNPTSTQNTLVDSDELDTEQHLHFINATEMPRWVFSNERKTFERCVQGNGSAL